MSNLPEFKRGMTLPGVIGRTVAESEPAWSEPARAKEDAPNISFYILDDVDYGQMPAFGWMHKEMTQS